MRHTVRQLAELAGVSVRTLHYYDEIGLLRPSSVGDNRYRYYTEAEVLRLQQILFFRELDFSLGEIKAILDQPAFDALAALRAHRQALQARVKRLSHLIDTVDQTILRLTGESTMSNQQLFDGFSDEDEKRAYEKARERWGAEEVDASYKLWNSYSAEKKTQIKAEGGAIYTDLAQLVGQDPAGDPVQAVIARWHQHLRYFYEPSLARLRGLGQLYVDSPEFTATIGSFHSELPEFMRQAISIYCDRLEGGARPA